MNRLFQLLALFMCTSLQAQDSKNQIGIEFYRPNAFDNAQSYDTPSTEYVYISDGSNISGAELAFGLFYKRSLKNDWFLDARAGIAIDRRIERLDRTYVGEFGFDYLHQTLNLSIDKKQMNIFVGAGKSIGIGQRFSIDVGLSIATLFDINNSYDYHFAEENTQTFYSADVDFKYERKYVNWMHIGLMPIIRPTFHINDKLDLSAELQFMLAYSVSNGKESMYRVEDIYEVNNGNVYTYYNEYDLEYSSKSSLISTSKISPLIRLSYKF